LANRHILFVLICFIILSTQSPITSSKGGARKSAGRSSTGAGRRRVRANKQNDQQAGWLIEEAPGGKRGGRVNWPRLLLFFLLFSLMFVFSCTAARPKTHQPQVLRCSYQIRSICFPKQFPFPGFKDPVGHQSSFLKRIRKQIKNSLTLECHSFSQHNANK